MLYGIMELAVSIGSGNGNGLQPILCQTAA